MLALTEKDDAAFWKVFQTELIDPNPPLEIDIVYVIALTMFRATKMVLGGPEVPRRPGRTGAVKCTPHS